MLVKHSLRRRAVRHSAGDDGAILVTVVVVMLVGFVIAATIAASVMFTLQANHANKDRTLAFVAAESGRDVAYEMLSGVCDPDRLDDDAAIGENGEAYNYSVLVTDDTEPADPLDPDSFDGLESECPTVDTARVVITSIGTGSDQSQARVVSVYPWDTILTDQPGGTMAFFDGKFKTTGSGYTGDLVVRTGNYNCSNDALIAGDLWVVNGLNTPGEGNVTLSSDCVITGNIYAAGNVTSSSQPVTVGNITAGTGGDIVALGSISLKSDGMTIVGDVHSGADVILDGTGSTVGTIGGDVKAFSTVTGEESTKWDIEGDVSDTQPKPTFDPTLKDVFDMTTWVDLGLSTSWNSTEFPVTTDSTCPADPDAVLDDGTGRLIVDLKDCATGGGGGKVYITLDGATITRDVLFLVPSAAQMNVSITGNILSSGEPAPQMWFVHADKTTGDSEPKCGNGTQNDTFDVSSGRTVRARILVYTACGLTGTINSDFSGQIYVNADTRSVNADFTCTPMSWEPALPNLSCRIRGEGGAAGDPVASSSIGKLLFQTERLPTVEP